MPGPTLSRPRRVALETAAPLADVRVYPMRSHAEDAETGGGRNARVERSGDPQCERSTGLERIDHAVIPEARAGEIATRFKLVFFQRRAHEGDLILGRHGCSFARHLIE